VEVLSKKTLFACLGRYSLFTRHIQWTEKVFAHLYIFQKPTPKKTFNMVESIR